MKKRARAGAHQPPPPRGRLFWEGDLMSNMNDVVGLRLPYGVGRKHIETEFEPATGTAWGYMNPKGTPCFSLGLLKDIRAHDGELEAQGGRVDINGTLHPVHYFVVGARKLHEMGLVDVLAKDGEGEAAVRRWIAGNAKRRNGTQGMFLARRIVNPITRAELDAVAEAWVDTAMRLESRDLKMMDFLVRAQALRMEAGSVDEIAKRLNGDPVVAQAV